METAADRGEMDAFGFLIYHSTPTAFLPGRLLHTVLSEYLRVFFPIDDFISNSPPVLTRPSWRRDEIS